MTAAALPLDMVFHALAHPARREVVERLRRGPASATELARPFSMALPSFCQHLRVLEDAGVVRSTKHGRVRTYEFVPERLGAAEDWLAEQRSLWQTRLDQLDSYLKSLTET